MSYGPQEAGEPHNLGSRDTAARGVGRSRRTAAAGAGSSRSGLSYRHGEHGPATPLATSEAGGVNENREGKVFQGLDFFAFYQNGNIKEHNKEIRYG